MPQNTQGPYVVGASVRVSAKMYAFGGALTDGTTVVCRWRQPNGTTGSDTATHDGTGLYHYDIDTSGGAPGQWWYGFFSGGSAKGAQQGYFEVSRDRTL